MTLPLSYYYMYSSHNTYLESDQIIGKSSVNRYINDLLRGVRCVELDTWDGPDGNPVIKHGGTLTSSIKFVGTRNSFFRQKLFSDCLVTDVVKAIRTFGFVTSPYPVVLSIENHCSQAQQRRMAIMMRGLFGDMLMEADSELYSRPDVLLRSPADLRNKILVKGSRPKNATVDLPEDEDYDDDEDGEEQCTYSDDENSADDKDFNEDDSSGIPPTIQRSSLERDIVMSSTSGGPVGRRVKSVRDASNPAPALSRQVSQFSTASSDSAVSRTSKVSRSSASTTSSISSALGLVKEKPHEFLSSITYLATCKVLTFDKEYSRSIPADHISSFKESKTEKHVRKRAQGWIEHNKTHLRSATLFRFSIFSYSIFFLSRIYPEGTRIDSSNYDPMPAWSVGAQVIALNTQTHDIPNVLNDGLFRHNGGCGYVLKPDYLLYEEFKLSPPLVINVNVISGQHIPRLKGSLAVRRSD